MASSVPPASSGEVPPFPPGTSVGRAGARGRGRGGSSSRSHGTPRTSFVGNTKEMNEHVFQCFNECDDKNQFVKTVEALGVYIAKNVKYPGDMLPLTKELIRPTLEEPDDLPATETSRLKVALWEKKVANYSVRLDLIESNLKAIYAVIWGQCSEAMRSKLKTLHDYQKNNDESDCVWLLKTIKGIMMRFEGQRYIFLSLDDAYSRYYTYKQGPEMSLSTYLAEFQGLVDVLEHYGGSIGDSKGYTDAVTASSVTSEKITVVARNKSIALSFLKRADRRRFGTLWTDLENQYSRGFDQYPKDLTEAYSLLVNYKVNHESSRRSGSTHTEDPTQSGLTFAQAINAVAGTDGVTHSRITCFHCNSKGHYANMCPNHVQLLQTTYGLTFTNFRHNFIPATWILLDSQSTVSVFCNSDFLTNIRKSPYPLQVYTNGGSQTSTLLGNVQNFGSVWYNPQSLANILSLAEVRKKCRVTMDTAVEAALCVHRSDGTIMKFQEFDSGLYYFDTNDTNESVMNYSFVTTVAGNKARFHRREIAGADRARELYAKIGHPSQQHFEHILSHNLIRNCPVTVDDAKRAHLIYGPDIASLKGKTTKGPAQHVDSFVPVDIPAPILADHKNVTLCADFFYVQGYPFFHTISRKIKFRTVSVVDDRKKTTILKETSQVLSLYNTRGFRVHDIHADLEFECIQNEILPCILDLTPQDAHVGEVERSIRTIKERVRADIHSLPFKRLPKMIIIELVRRAVKTLNQFPALDGVSDTLSPLTIMTGKATPDYNHMQLDFGSYVLVFEDTHPTNTTRARSTGAIALNPTGNTQGDYHFMSLTTGRRLSRRQWTAVPMSNDVIAAVEARALAEGQPLIVGSCPVFERRPNRLIPDDDNIAEDFDENVFFNEDTNLFFDHEPAVAEADDTEHEFFENDPPAVVDAGDTEHEQCEIELTDEQNEQETHEVGEGHRQATIEPLDAQGAEDDQEPATSEPQEDQGAGGEQGHNYNLRKKRSTDYSHRFDHQLLQQSHIFGTIMTQMTASAGIKKHGQKAVDALFREFSQLDDKSVFNPVHATQLTSQQKKEALRAINLIKEKKDGKLKGRTCADGRPQRNLYSKEETSSPTVSTDALMMSLMIDAYEKRDVATADVVGAYLLADMDEFTLLKLTGETVDILREVNPKYGDFVTVENGKRVLYVQLLKALYGCVQSALLWYELFSGTLQKVGFELNPYDPCVANKLINGKQCTILWYVDDSKISHVEEQVVSDVIKMIEGHFGKMTVTRGKDHVFLGMEIKFNDNGTLNIGMRTYVEEAIKEFGEDVSCPIVNPAGKGLFTIDGKSTTLNKEMKDRFHSIVAKLLYVSKRGRPDIQLAIGFLCTRVSCSTIEDWTKLKRTLRYLAGSIEEELTLGADNIATIRTWVDAAYGVHNDMKSHTGGVISFGRGAIICKSIKQKLNTKSSTEAELVGATDYLPNTIWAKNFLEAQGYEIEENVFGQDNQSAIKLETNGRASCGQKSRHIDIRFFFMKDRIKTEGITIAYCPTEQMLADFFTKPLQGNLFRKFQRVIMGHDHINSLLSPSTLVPTEERVDSQEQNDDVMNENTTGPNVDETCDEQWTVVRKRVKRKEVNQHVDFE